MLPQLRRRPSSVRRVPTPVIDLRSTTRLDAALSELDTRQAEVESTLAELEARWATLSARLSASAARPGSVPELVGVVEIAKRLELTEAKTAQALLANYKGFPAPVAKLRMGYVWLWSDVQVWDKARSRTSEPV